MIVAQAHPDCIAEHWPWMAEVLRPAIAVDPLRNERDVLAQLIDGSLTAWGIDGHEASGLVVTQIDGLDFWVIYASGRVFSGAGRTMRALMSTFEDIAKHRGCTTMRLEGRDWRPVLKDYESARLESGRFSMTKAV